MTRDSLIEPTCGGRPALRRPNCRRLAAKTLVSIGVVFGICGIWPADLARADGQLPSPITAQFVAAGRSNGPVLYLGGTTYSAAPSSYRINSGPTVPAFSLRLAGEANPSDVLSAIRARDYGTIPGANQATYLAANHSMLGKPLQSKAELAAVQLAIWWFTDSIPLTRTSIPNAKFRGRARRLVAAARGKQGPDLPSSLGVRAFTIGGDLQNERVQLQVRSDDIEDTFNTFQDIDVRVGDDFATVSTGTVTLLDISAPRPTPHRIPISILPRYLTEQGALTLLVPHQSGVTHLEIGWGATLDPGVLFGPSGSSPAVVTATSFHLRFVTDYFTHPPGVTELINFGQQGLIAHLPRNRVFALTIFLFLVAIAAKLADLVIAVLKRLFGFVRSRAQRRRASADTGD